MFHEPGRSLNFLVHCHSPTNSPPEVSPQFTNTYADYIHLWIQECMFGCDHLQKRLGNMPTRTLQDQGGPEREVFTAVSTKPSRPAMQWKKNSCHDYKLYEISTFKAAEKTAEKTQSTHTFEQNIDLQSNRLKSRTVQVCRVMSCHLFWW